MLEKLTQICNEAIQKKNLGEEYLARLKPELKEIDDQNESEYFLSLYENKTKYPENQNNLLVVYLLDITKQFDINKQANSIYGDFPDVDVDFISLELRDALKARMAEIYGREKVCSIGSYNTFGIKSSILNMARVHGLSHSEAVEITKQLDLKDEDGKDLTWDKALEQYPDFKAYCEKEEHKEAVEAARKLISRNNSMSKHAGGLIISGVRIDNFVPLVKDKEGNPLSAWPEGLHTQDLGPVGLVKFDLLVITNLMQIAKACKLIKERHGLTSICALPGQSDWSDTAYLNDPKSLEMANNGDLKCIFQFDSDGIRALAKDGGVTSFDDLVAYSAVFRPSCIQEKMHTAYVNRKRGKEKYEIHPKLQHVLGATYAVILYQEQAMQVLNIVGDIPLKDCEILRKAISKKNEKYFAKYREMFIENGQKNLNISKEEVEKIWNQLYAFSSYAFNKSHSCAYCYISARLLWLKAHYPLEFFAGILSCEDTTEKMKEYKVEAERYGICIKPIDINRSGVNFQIRDFLGEPSCIYFGFSNVKGIGETIAERIVENQPYRDFKDFLPKFGTDASVIKPLVGLRVFPENDPISLYKYYEWFKKGKKRKVDRIKRYETKISKMKEELKSLIPEQLWDSLPNKDLFSEEFMRIFTTYGTDWEEQDMLCINWDEIQELEYTYKKAVEIFNNKIDVEDEFNPDEVVLDEKLVAIYNSIELSEKKFYGFLWTHPLERSPDYQGDRSFYNMRQNNKSVDRVEVRIEEAKKMTSKKGTTYWLLNTEDVAGEMQFVQVWADDWERFGEDLVEGQLCCLELKAPDGGFKRYTLNSPPKWQRDRLPKNKEYDFRVVVYQKEEV